jgi:hypothetical protein
MRPSLRAQRLRVAPKQSCQRYALACGVSVASLRLAYSETPKRNALRCARLAMTCLDPALHESWQDFLIFVRGKGFINDDGG